VAPPQRQRVGRRRDHVQEELVTEGVDDPDHLQRERIEFQAVIPAIGSDKRDRIDVAGLDGRDRMPEQYDIPHDVVQQAGIASGGLPDEALQFGEPVGVEHAPSAE
jgi:hypothetical protein